MANDYVKPGATNVNITRINKIKSQLQSTLNKCQSAVENDTGRIGVKDSTGTYRSTVMGDCDNGYLVRWGSNNEVENSSITDTASAVTINALSADKDFIVNWDTGEAFRVDGATGKLGIGTTTPNAQISWGLPTVTAKAHFQLVADSGNIWSFFSHNTYWNGSTNVLNDATKHGWGFYLNGDSTDAFYVYSLSTANGWFYPLVLKRDGRLLIRNSVSDAYIAPGNVQMEVDIAVATYKGLVIKGFTAQSGTLQEWQNISSGVLASVSAAGQFALNIATGTSPFAISSTTVNTNLNADLLDGNHAVAFALATHYHSTLYNPALSAAVLTTDVLNTASSITWGSRTAETWGYSAHTFRLGQSLTMSFYDATDNFNITNNLYDPGTGWKYINNGEAMIWNWNSNILSISAYNTGVAGATAAGQHTLFTLSGLYDTDAAIAIFNNNLVNMDFQIKGDTDANLFYVDGSADLIGIGTNAPSTGNKLQIHGNLALGVAGNGLRIKSGSNARIGSSTLVAGTITVSNTSVTANTVIIPIVQSLGTVTVPSTIAVTARVANTSFTLTASDPTDTSVIGWMLVESF